MSNLWSSFLIWFEDLTIWKWWNPAEFMLATPSEEWKFMWAYIAFLGALLIAGIFTIFWKGKQYYRESISALAWNNLVIGIFLFFFRWQEIPVLGMDIWRFLQELAIVVWLIRLALIYRAELPQEKLHAKVSAYKQKYLPKAKKA